MVLSIIVWSLLTGGAAFGTATLEDCKKFSMKPSACKPAKILSGLDESGPQFKGGFYGRGQ